MKVLHINQSDLAGGAAIAAYRLHQGLLGENIDSRLLVGKIQVKSDRVANIPRSPRWESKIAPITQSLGFNFLHHVGAFDIPKHSFYQEADVLNFHNLHSGTFSYLTLPRLTRDKPAVLTLHDMWSFTGHCAYSYDCDRWQTGCGKCPYPRTYPTIKRDSTHWEWRLKKWLYHHSNLTIVADSQWLAQQAKQSILNGFPIHHIPYGLDTELYQPLDRQKAKSLLNIDASKKVLLTGADNLNDPRKGGDLLCQALSQLPQSLKSEIVLLLLGRATSEMFEKTGIETINLGYLSNDQLKAIAYSVADLFLFPTRADAFGIVAQEAAACGTPTVAFDVGGVSDMVRSGINGYLAKPENTQDFSEGIIQLLEDEQLRQKFSQNCRAIVLKEYPLALQAQRYLQIYQKILTG